jgi:WD40 repeat protein/uncharacterized caspase-like protein
MRKLLLFLCIFSFTLFLFAQKPQLIPPMSHAAYVRALAVSSDGQYLLSGAGYLDNTVLMWSTDGHLLKILEGHQNDLFDLEISNDGRHMLSLETGSWAVHLWDKQGKKLRSFKNRGFYNVGFAPDNQHILAGGAGGSLQLLNLNGETIRSFKGSTALIQDVCFSRDGKYLAASDAEGLIRIYTLDGQLKQTLDGHQRKAVLSIQFSADGQKLLSGGDDKMAVLWDWQNASILKRLEGHRTIVRSVAASSDGQYWATGGPDEAQAFLWDAAGNLLRKIKTPLLNELCFSADNQSLFVAPRGKGVQRYSLEGKLLHLYANASSAVTSVGFSPFAPDSLFLVTGGEGQHIRLWDALSGEASSFWDQKDFNTPVAFNPQYPSLLIAQDGDSIYQYNLYDDVHATVPKGSYSSHSALAYGPDGNYFLISNFSGGIQLWQEGEEAWEEIWNHNLPSNRVSSLAFAPDGEQFLLATNRDWVPHIGKYSPEKREQAYSGQGFPVALHQVEDFAEVRTFGKAASFAAFSPNGQYIATNEDFGLSLYERSTGKELFHVDVDKSLGQFALITCLAFAPDGQSIVAGFTSNVLKQYNLKGQVLREFKGHFSTIRSVEFSPSGKYLLSGSSDNTAKLWNAQTGAELATLMAVDKEDWLVITPEGLFDASPGAMSKLYFVAGLEIIALEQLKERYYEPGLLAKVLGFGEGPLRKVNDLDAQDLALYPELIEAKLLEDKILVRLKQRSGGIGPVSLRLDDIEIAPDVNPQRKTEFSIDLKNYAGYFISGDSNRLSLTFYNAEAWLPSPAQSLLYFPGGGKGSDKPSATVSLSDRTDQALVNTLYALIIGTSDYKGTTLDLKFPDKDATAYRDMLEESGKGLFGTRMQIKLLNTAKGNPRPTKTAIRNALLEFAAKAEPKDVLVVYFSGHGTTWPENTPSSQFYYLSADNESFDLNNAANREHAIAQDSLQAWIRGVKARKRILILDACNSGEIVKQLDEGAKGSTLSTDQRRALERMKDRAGFFVLASSSADKLSYEDPRFGHGLLTYSLLNNMPKIAALDPKNFIDVGKLFQEVREDVPKLAAALSKVQEPKLIGMEDFSIGVIKAGTPIKLPAAKKIVIRSDFSNKKRLDPLKLKPEVNTQLEALLANPQLPFAYYPSDKAAGLHYFVNGEYDVVGNTVKVNAYLYQSDKEEELDTFSVEGSSTDVKALVEKLMEKIQEALLKLK